KAIETGREVMRRQLAQFRAIYFLCLLFNADATAFGASPPFLKALHHKNQTQNQVQAQQNDHPQDQPPPKAKFLLQLHGQLDEIEPTYFAKLFDQLIASNLAQDPSVKK